MTLFSTNCPKCHVLEKKLKDSNFSFDISNDIQELLDLGYNSAPILKLDNGEYLNFAEALKYISERG